MKDLRFFLVLFMVNLVPLAFIAAAVIFVRLTGNEALSFIPLMLAALTKWGYFNRPAPPKPEKEEPSYGYKTGE